MRTRFFIIVMVKKAANRIADSTRSSPQEILKSLADRVKRSVSGTSIRSLLCVTYTLICEVAALQKRGCGRFRLTAETRPKASTGSQATVTSQFPAETSAFEQQVSSVIGIGSSTAAGTSTGEAMLAPGREVCTVLVTCAGRLDRGANKAA